MTAWLRAALVCACLTAISLFSGLASANAPMCDPSGASIEADIPAPPAFGGEINVLAPCPFPEFSTFSLVNRAPDQAPPLAFIMSDRCVVTLLQLRRIARPWVQLSAATVQGEALPGYGRQVYRPPAPPRASPRPLTSQRWFARSDPNHFTQ